MVTRTTICVSLALLSSLAVAAINTTSEMAIRYVDVQHCMEHALGKRWQDRYAIELAVNRWGAAEPTRTAIDSAPEAVRMTDLRCRRELDVAGQPRP